MDRRKLLASVPLAALALSGCAGLTASQVTTQVVTDLQTLATGLSAELPTISKLTGIPAATLSTASAYLAQAIGLAQGVTSDLTTASAAPLVSKIETAVNSAISVLSKFPLPPQFLMVLNAAQVLLPIIEAAVGLAVPAKATPGGITPDQARAILASA